MLGYTSHCWRRFLARLKRWGMKMGAEKRQWIRYRSAAQVACRPVPDATACLSAAVQDVSSGGIGLRMDRPLNPGMLLHVELPGAAPPAKYLLACVAHANRGPEGGWSLGCSFIRELTEPELRCFL